MGNMLIYLNVNMPEVNMDKERTMKVEYHHNQRKEMFRDQRLVGKEQGACKAKNNVLADSKEPRV